MTTPKNRKKTVDPEHALRTKLGIWDMSVIENIRKDITPWVGTDADGEQVIYRCRSGSMAFAVHNIGRYFARKRMNFSKPGRHVIEVAFTIHRYGHIRMKTDVTLKVPYTVVITHDVEGERMDPKALAWVNNIQEKGDDNA